MNKWFKDNITTRAIEDRMNATSVISKVRVISIPFCYF